jgi:hypothetical protein
VYWFERLKRCRTPRVLKSKVEGMEEAKCTMAKPMVKGWKRKRSEAVLTKRRRREDGASAMGSYMDGKRK